MYVGNKKVIPVLKVVADSSIKYAKLILPVIKGGNYNTLDVVTDPSDAVCTLTYGGNSYITKHAVVPTGTIVSYSIYSPSHPEYGTEIGTLTMDADKTLTCTGTTTPVYSNFVRPDLTANGTLGGDAFAVAASSYAAGNVAYRAVDNSDTTYWLSDSYGNDGNLSDDWYKLYNPDAINIKLLTMVNRASQNNGITEGVIYASDTDSDYSSIISFTNSNTTAKGVWTIDLSSNNLYRKYYKLQFTKFGGTINQRYGLIDIGITATYQSSSSYGWTVAVS